MKKTSTAPSELCPFFIFTINHQHHTPWLVSVQQAAMSCEPQIHHLRCPQILNASSITPIHPPPPQHASTSSPLLYDLQRHATATNRASCLFFLGKYCVFFGVWRPFTSSIPDAVTLSRDAEIKTFNSSRQQQFVWLVRPSVDLSVHLPLTA